MEKYIEDWVCPDYRSCLLGELVRVLRQHHFVLANLPAEVSSARVSLFVVVYVLF